MRRVLMLQNTGDVLGAVKPVCRGGFVDAAEHERNVLVQIVASHLLAGVVVADVDQVGSPLRLSPMPQPRRAPSTLWCCAAWCPSSNTRCSTHSPDNASLNPWS